MKKKKRRLTRVFAILAFACLVLFGYTDVSASENVDTPAKEKEVRFYVRIDGEEQIENGTTHYPQTLYSSGVAGELKQKIPMNKDNCGDTYIDDIRANFVTEPAVEEFEIEGNHYSSGEYTIKWYVIKEESDFWHVDGILVKKPMYTVTFFDEDGTTVLLEKQVREGAKADCCTTPQKQTESGKAEDGAAYQKRYGFKQWKSLAEDCSLEQLNCVTHDLAFQAEYECTEVPVCYYIRLDGEEQEDFGSHDPSAYSKGVEGTLRDLCGICCQDDPENYKEKIKANICKAPSITEFDLTDLNVKDSNQQDVSDALDTYTIGWYLIQEESDEWRVEGILEKNADDPEKTDDPENPNNPEEPNEPNQPNDPKTPDEPNQPNNPEQPNNPKTPDEPEQPNKPEQPVKPTPPKDSGQSDVQPPAIIAPPPKTPSVITVTKKDTPVSAAAATTTSTIGTTAAKADVVTTKTVVKTADETESTKWLCVAAVAMLVLVTLAGKKEMDRV